MVHDGPWAMLENIFIPFLSEESLYRPICTGQGKGVHLGEPPGGICDQSRERICSSEKKSGVAVRSKFKELLVGKTRGTGVSPMDHPEPWEKPADVLPLLEGAPRKQQPWLAMLRWNDIPMEIAVFINGKEREREFKLGRRMTNASGSWAPPSAGTCWWREMLFFDIKPISNWFRIQWQRGDLISWSKTFHLWSEKMR